MKTLTLKCKSKTNATLVSNDFIDHFMAGANGEFVKVYLFLLRHMADTCTTFSVSQIADCLNHTESDVLRAFRYWDGQGLLLLDTDAEGNITSVCIERASAMSAEPASQKVQRQTHLPLSRTKSLKIHRLVPKRFLWILSVCRKSRRI